MTIRVVIADDHPIYRDGVRTALATDGRAVVVGEALDGSEVLDLVLDLHPEVVLMDLSMPRLDGVEATRQLTERCPDAAVVVLTMAQDDDSLFAALKAGARGYLLKGADSEELVRALLAVADGDAVFGPGVAGRVLHYFATGSRPESPAEGLTQREREILDLVATGLGNQAIATRMGIAPKTVRNHVANVIAKLQVADRGEAIARGRALGLGRPTANRQTTGTDPSRPGDARYPTNG